MNKKNDKLEKDLFEDDFNESAAQEHFLYEESEELISNISMIFSYLAGKIESESQILDMIAKCYEKADKTQKIEYYIKK